MKAKIFTLLFFMILLVFGCSKPKNDLQNSKTYDIQIRHEGETKLVIENENGNINVTAVDGADMSGITAVVTVDTKNATDLKAFLESIEVKFQREGDTIHAAAIIPKTWTMPGKIKKPDKWSVDMTINIPGGHDVECSLSKGDIEILGPSASVTAQTTEGNVTVKNNKGTVIANTSKGDSTVENDQDYKSFIRQNSKDGSIILKMPNAKYGTYILDTSIGNISASLDSATEVDLNCKVLNGNIDILLGRRTNAVVDIKTKQGKVSSDMTINTTTSAGGTTSDTLINGMLGGGLGKIVAQTQKGNITMNYSPNSPIVQ